MTAGLRVLMLDDERLGTRCSIQREPVIQPAQVIPILVGDRANMILAAQAVEPDDPAGRRMPELAMPPTGAAENIITIVIILSVADAAADFGSSDDGLIEMKAALLFDRIGHAGLARAVLVRRVRSPAEWMGGKRLFPESWGSFIECAGQHVVMGDIREIDFAGLHQITKLLAGRLQALFKRIHCHSRR